MTLDYPMDTAEKVGDLALNLPLADQPVEVRALAYQATAMAICALHLGELVRAVKDLDATIRVHGEG